MDCEEASSSLSSLKVFFVQNPAINAWLESGKKRRALCSNERLQIILVWRTEKNLTGFLFQVKLKLVIISSIVN